MKKYTYIFFFFIFHAVFAQEYSANRYPLHFNQFTESIYLNNSSINGMYQQKQGKVGYLGHPGVFKKIRSFYAFYYSKLPEKHTNSPQFLGFSVINDQEGLLLQQTKLYIHYNWQTKLTEKLRLSAGISLGINSYFIDGDTPQTEGSDMVPDGSFGIWLAHQKYYIGLASTQLFQAKLQPLQETFLLKRSYQSNFGYLLLNKEKGKLYIHSEIRYLNKDYITSDASLLFNYIDFAFLGISNYWRENIGFSIGLQQKVDKGYLMGFFSYHVPIKSQQKTEINTFEITISFINNKRTFF